MASVMAGDVRSADWRCGLAAATNESWLEMREARTMVMDTHPGLVLQSVEGQGCAMSKQRLVLLYV